MFSFNGFVINPLQVVKYFLLLAVLAPAGFAANAQTADKLVTGRIWTANATQPWVEAMAISGGKILAVGSQKDLKGYVGKQTVLVKAAEGQLIVPGFIDNHTHFMDGGYMIASVQLRDAKTPAEFIKRIKEFAKTIKPGTWIIGGAWDHQLWGGELPDKAWIDSVTKDNPVWVNRLDGHLCLANSVALKLAGVTDDIADISGGHIERENGHVTGLLKDNAKKMVQDIVPEPSAEMKDRAMDAAMNYVASNGVTSIVSLTGTGLNDYFDVYKRAHDTHRLITRVYAATMLERWAMLADSVKRHGRGDEWFKIGALKGFVDGGLGAHTAFMLKPFSDSPTDSGFMVIDSLKLYSQVKSADSAGLQVIIHAIGDRAIHTLLNIYQKVETVNGNKDRRFRMEHTQHLDPADINRFAQLNVIPSMQPYHAIDDGRWADKYIGPERARYAYAFKSLLNAKAKLAFGSDWFVAPASPIMGIYAAATRRTIDGLQPNGWVPEEKITVLQALNAYTINGAYAIFEEKSRGSLEKGKLADFVILDQDITKIDPVAIEHVKVLQTYVGGKAVYTKAK
jgi:predicted amidohydrolase YtcJ